MNVIVPTVTMRVFLIFSAFLAFCTGVPSPFPKCKKSQPDLNECLSKAVINALEVLHEPKKELGMVSIDPLEIPSLRIGAGTSAVQFSQNYKNLKLEGFGKPSTLKINADFGKNVLILDARYPKIVFNFNYEIEGSILILPINGKGLGVITLDDVHVILTIHLEKYDKKGATYYKIPKENLKIEPSNVHFRLDNLFNGDKHLGDNVNQVMNDNWKQVYEDVQSSYEDAFSSIFSSIFSEFLERVPASEWIPD